MTDAAPDLVIGSGPAGVSVATALLARGRRVVMLDGGADLPADLQDRRQTMAARPAQNWSDDDRSIWQRPQFDAGGREVRRYGSGYAMQPEAATFADAGGLALRASRAIGGLSNYWGAAVLPYRQEDMAGWPITAQDLAPHYAAVARFMPIAGRDDALAALFPALSMADRTALPAGPQAAAMLARTADTAEFHLGQARQAVAAGCQRCGLCLHGCPWELIWSARQQVAKLAQHAAFSHHPGQTVRRFDEGPQGVTVTLSDGRTITGARLYIAAGVLETARLYLASRPGATALDLRDSAQAFLPMIQRGRNSRAPDRMPFHTLPQLFAELTAPEVSPYTVHAQIYTWNEYFARELAMNYGRKLPGSGAVWPALARRLIVAQVFVHSDHSARAHLTLDADGRLRATVQTTADTGQVMTAAARRLSRHFSRLGVSALRFALRTGAVGSSFHAGATLPMMTAPQRDQTDVLGRPGGLERVHVVDASVLPAIPATTITFAVMANAHRIGMANL